MKLFLRITSVVICICLLFTFLTACDKKEETTADTVTSIYATFYPLYAAAEWLLKGVPNVQLNCLVQPQDGCLRDYRLSDWDLALLSQSDLIIAGGCGLESFESLLYELGESGPAVNAVLYNMDLIEQRGCNTQEDRQSHWIGDNPHIYMKTDCMIEIVRRIANSLILLDPEHEQLYIANLKAAESELNALHQQLSLDLASVAGKKVIVMNESFVYAVQEYGLDASLFYERESGENIYDADLDECLHAIEGSDAQVILIEKQAPQSLCEALERAGYHLARLDTMSTIHASNGTYGYSEAHKANVAAILEAFLNP